MPVSLSDSCLYDDTGSAIGRVLVVRDLEELVSLRSRLLTSARLAAVGQLAAGIAHEINNPIAYVRSNVGLLERHWKDLSAAFESRTAAPAVTAALTRSRELLRAAADGIDRITSIVRDVGGFSWKGGSENEPADPVELLETALRVAGPPAPPQGQRRAPLPEASAGPLPASGADAGLPEPGAGGSAHDRSSTAFSSSPPGSKARSSGSRSESTARGSRPRTWSGSSTPSSPSHGGVAQAGSGSRSPGRSWSARGAGSRSSRSWGAACASACFLPATAAPPEARLMHPLAILQLFASVTAVMIAVALVATDPRQRANRLVAAVLVCSAWWSIVRGDRGLLDDPRRSCSGPSSRGSAGAGSVRSACTSCRSWWAGRTGAAPCAALGLHLRDRPRSFSTSARRGAWKLPCGRASAGG